MILIFEIDKTVQNGKRWTWRPMRFHGTWKGKTTWRVGWGIFSISYYPSSSLKKFSDELQGMTWRTK